jgi:hypothetical protein
MASAVICWTVFQVPTKNSAASDDEEPPSSSGANTLTVPVFNCFVRPPSHWCLRSLVSEG